MATLLENVTVPARPAAEMTDDRPSLAGAGRPALAAALGEAGVPDRQIRMRSGQFWHWLYTRGASDFEAMSNVSKALRAQLADRFTLARPEIASEQVSVDGTRKWLLRLAPARPGEPGHEVEAVYIPEEGRGTLCVSSQVGCTLSCAFCHTGTQRMVRNLTAAEIVGQVLVARDRLGDWPDARPPAGAYVPGRVDGAAAAEGAGAYGGRYVTNIVFMGMGEPLYNTDNVMAAIDVLSDGEGLSISRRRITVSTSGIVPQIERLGAESNPMLAISLHAVRDDLRDVLVPINRKHPLDELMRACRDYPGLSNARRITFEYVMLKGVNDSPAEARELVRLLKGIPAKINLIPFNPWPGAAFECSDWEDIERFSDIVFRAGYASPVRTPRGRDILAACGQLKSASEVVRAKARAAAASGAGGAAG